MRANNSIDCAVAVHATAVARIIYFIVLFVIVYCYPILYALQSEVYRVSVSTVGAVQETFVNRSIL